LDHELVEYLAAFPSQMKIRGRELKYVLRRLSESYLPPEIVRREKQGFMFPIAYWFRHDRHALLRDLLLDSHFVREGLFRRAAIEQMLREHRESRVDHHVRLWLLLNLVLWRQMYVEGESVTAVTDMMKAREKATIGRV
jgi:asparagine synthase (glutamine-hydrolysing)